jgi:hypothetical protein
VLLQLSGRAALAWDDGDPADELHTGRGVSFTPERVVVTRMPSSPVGE